MGMHAFMIHKIWRISCLNLSRLFENYVKWEKDNENRVSLVEKRGFRVSDIPNHSVKFAGGTDEIRFSGGLRFLWYNTDIEQEISRKRMDSV